MSLPQDLNLAALPSQPYASPRILKWLYCTGRVSSSLFMLPYWAIKHSCGPKPRSTWSLSETLLVDFTRRVSAITDQAGVQHSTRDPTAEPHRDHLKETRFEWVPGVAGASCCGVLDDKDVRPLKRVGTFIWERETCLPDDDAESEGSQGDDASTKGIDLGQTQTELPKDTPDGSGCEGRGDLVGIYFHGGGYTHFSAHEDSQTSIIPRRLMLTDCFSSIHAVEYRLLPDSPFPAALQDGVSVYAQLIRSGVPSHKIVLIGDSAGGNIVLALARWIRDEKRTAPPGGLLLLSPWCDPSHSFPHSTTSYISRPNPEDYLADDPTARRLLVTSLLGTKPHSELSSPYISPASQLGPHGSFDGFSPTFIHYGDAERLEAEIESLVKGMTRDGVPLVVEKTPDAVHDVLMVRFWNEEVRQTIYNRITDWLDDVMSRSETRGGAPRRELGEELRRNRTNSMLSVNPEAGSNGLGTAPKESKGRRIMQRAASSASLLIPGLTKRDRSGSDVSNEGSPLSHTPASSEGGATFKQSPHSASSSDTGVSGDFGKGHAADRVELVQAEPSDDTRQ
ncbi:uncharacterized protein JCM15063_003889 [Sporobolomyces koalae]|uniref:uncharacterized protein n=1 Tax=Sporobolomyces koalae TaxID=500713 RepID=UPI00316DC465